MKFKKAEYINNNNNKPADNLLDLGGV